MSQQEIALDVLEKIAQTLRDGCKAIPADGEQWRMPRLMGPKGIQITFHGDRYTDPKRWELRVSCPELENFNPCGFPRITVSATKSPYQIAGDISRRIFPQAFTSIEEGHARRSKHYRDRETARQRMSLLEDLGVEVRLSNDRPHEHTQFHGTFGDTFFISGSVQVNPKDSEITITDAPHDLVLEIVRMCMPLIEKFRQEKPDDDQS